MVYNICEIIWAKSITTRLQLVFLGPTQEREGKQWLVQFIANQCVDQALALAEEFSTAESLLECSKRM